MFPQKSADFCMERLLAIGARKKKTKRILFFSPI
jgi:hypothetical protein